MKKQIEIIIIICFILLCSCSNKNIKTDVEDNWNGGYCEIDNGRLTYIGTNNRELYKCEKCNKIYKFNSIMKYNH